MREMITKVTGGIFALAVVGALGFGVHEVYAGRASANSACSQPAFICDSFDQCEDYCLEWHNTEFHDCDDVLHCCVCG